MRLTNGGFEDLHARLQICIAFCKSASRFPNLHGDLQICTGFPDKLAELLDDDEEWEQSYRSLHLGDKLIALAVRFAEFDGQPIFEYQTVRASLSAIQSLMVTCVVPSRQGVFTRYARWPDARRSNRSTASGGLNM